MVYGAYFDFPNISPQSLQFMIVPDLAYNVPRRLQSTEIPGLWDLGLRQGEPWHYPVARSIFPAPGSGGQPDGSRLMIFLSCALKSRASVLGKSYPCDEVLDGPHPRRFGDKFGILFWLILLFTEFIQLRWLFHRE
jgi:hypothetical protein